MDADGLVREKEREAKKERERQRMTGKRRAFWQGRPVGGPIVIQRCINNATGLLNALLPWGPLCLGEHCVCVNVYVCVSWPLRREREGDIERERERSCSQLK